MQFSQILDFLAKSSLPDPEYLRQHYASKRNLRRRKGNHVSHSSLSSSQLQQWGAFRSSSQILVQGSFRNRHLARDFAVDMIDLVSAAHVPVVWALNPTFDTHLPLTPMDVLKHVTLQVLRLNHTMMNERVATLNAARFQSTTTETGWFSLLGSALEGLPQLYIIIDLELLSKSAISGQDWLEEFPRLFSDLSARSIGTVLKVAFVSPLGTQEYTSNQTFGQSAVRLFLRHSTRSQQFQAADQRHNGNNRRKARKALMAAFRPS